MSFDLTNKNIQDTFQNLLQRTGSDNRLFDLTGNEIGDLRISGSLIAQQYVVSSSVTNITTQQLSGSTQFGDSLDDTHQFTGSLNVTGSITKGNIPFVLSNQTGSFVTNIDSPSQGNVRKTDVVTGVGSNISLGLRTTDNVKFNHITASGNISASGNLTTTNITSSGHFIGQLPPDGGDNVLRYLKTSGDASAVKIEMGDLTGDAGGGTTLVLDDDAAKVDITGNLLVSGILSSSGDLTSRGGTIERGFIINSDGGAHATVIRGLNDDNLFLANTNPSGVDKIAIGTTSFLSKLTIDGDLTTTSHITASGNISASGTIIGSNISGTNTGDQDLSGLALKTEVSGAFTSDSASFSTRISVNEVVTAKTLVSSSAQIASDISGSSTTLSSSLSTRVAANEVITARTLVSSSTQIADDISGSFTATSSSLSTRLATAESELNNTLISSSLQFDSSDNVTFNNITASGNISASGDVLNSQVVQMTNSSSVINTFNTGSHQTCKYVLQVTSGSFIQSSEMLVVQSGSNAFNTEYAQIGTAVNLGSFSTTVSGNVVKLNFAGDFISCSVKFNRTLI